MLKHRAHCIQTVLLVVAVLPACGVLLHAQDQRKPPQVTDIRFTGLKRIPEDTVLRAIRLRVGDVLTTQAVDDAIRRLDELGYFYPVGISVRREPFEGGVRLIFDLEERPLIEEVQFEGARAFTRDKLLGTVGLRPGDYLDFAVEKLSTEKIVDLYHDKGYLFVEVQRKDKVDKAENTVTITFVIHEGPKVKFKAIRFEGNHVYSDARLLSQMQLRTKTLFFWHNVFDPDKFRLDVVRVQDYYHAGGYLDAEVSGEAEYSLDHTEVTAVVRIVEGPRYVVNDVTLRGETVAGAADLRKQMKLKPGGPFDVHLYEHDTQAIKDWYTSRGYLEVRIRRRQVYPRAGRIDLFFDITENKRFNLGRLEIRGNRNTKDKVIRREFPIAPGDVFNTALVEKGMARLRYLQYFDQIEKSIVPGQTPDTYDLQVEVQEGRTGNMMFGAGLSSNYGLIGQVQLSLENFDIADFPKSWSDLFAGDAFKGAGQRLLLNWSPGTEVSQARLLFADPHIFDTDFSFSAEAFTYDRTWDDYDESRYGLRFGLGHKLTENLSAHLAWRMEQVKIDHLELFAAPDVAAVKGTNALRSLTFALNYDRTDARFDPSKGVRAGASVEMADKALGSDWNFVKGILHAALYHTLYETRTGRKHILAVNAEVGAVDAFDGQHMVPIFDRFYAGGRGSIRGFSYRGVGPKQGDTYVGGEYVSTVNTEYRFPVYAMWRKGKLEEVIRGVLFVDAGQIGYTIDDAGSAPWRASVGLGVRFHIPGLRRIPIALDWGFPVAKQDEDDVMIFSFNIGTDF